MSAVATFAGNWNMKVSLCIQSVMASFKAATGTFPNLSVLPEA